MEADFRAFHEPIRQSNCLESFPLPVEYYDKDALFDIAKKAGTSIGVDYDTDHVIRAMYARVCVDIDLQNAFSHLIFSLFPLWCMQ